MSAADVAHDHVVETYSRVGFNTHMSKRLQVVVDDAELRRFQRAARRSGLTLAEWVRQALRRAERTVSTTDAAYHFPTADVEQMVAEIERSYLGSRLLETLGGEQ